MIAPAPMELATAVRDFWLASQRLRGHANGLRWMTAARAAQSLSWCSHDRLRDRARRLLNTRLPPAELEA